jgi:hypothetical protein
MIKSKNKKSKLKTKNNKRIIILSNYQEINYWMIQKNTSSTDLI